MKKKNEKRKSDFSGYATKHNLKCSDGRIITPSAFKDNDGSRVPLVWQHQHNDPTNVLGHVDLEHRDDGVYAYGKFNDTPNGIHVAKLLEHNDIDSLSIFANSLVQKGSEVIHGNIREVSIVLAGANPGARIDNLSFLHDDGSMDPDLESAIIYAGDTLEHSDVLKHEDSNEKEEKEESGETVQDVFETLSEKQKNVVYALIGLAIEDAKGGNKEASHSIDVDYISHEDGETIEDVFNTFTDKQKNVAYAMIGDALENELQHDDEDGEIIEELLYQTEDGTIVDEEGTPVDIYEDDEGNLVDDNGNAITQDEEDNVEHSGGKIMKNNVFDNSTPNSKEVTLSHDELTAIRKDAESRGSLKDAFIAHATEYGIENIDILFDDAKLVRNELDMVQRDMAWVEIVLKETHHVPFGRIKTRAADITAEEARAMGFVKGNRKKEEIVKVMQRVTTPKTVYKKQALDRDDIVDINSIDVIAWMKKEMRVMLNEEIARAALVSDGREIDDEDKIDEEHIRPIWKEDEFYVHRIPINAGSSTSKKIESVIRARRFYKGSGNPTFFTSSSFLTDMLTMTNGIGDKVYKTEEEVAAALRVSKIVEIPVMDEGLVRKDEDDKDWTLTGIIVNLKDYTFGTNDGGEISFFDDFDIDFNLKKFLIETRTSGALTLPKCAMILESNPDEPLEIVKYGVYQTEDVTPQP